MAVKIRMKRVGAKNAPVFRIVVADGRSPRDGKFIEELGTYQPLKKGTNYKLDLDRAKYWLSKGAQPSDTVASFLKKAGRAAAATAAA
jgi:small subunit ribosomal protein S16